MSVVGPISRQDECGAKLVSVEQAVGTIQSGAAVTVPRTYLDYVVTEFGIAELRGKTLAQRRIVRSARTVRYRLARLWAIAALWAPPDRYPPSDHRGCPLGRP